MITLDEWQTRANNTTPPDLPEPLTRKQFDKLTKPQQKAWLNQRQATVGLPWPTIITPQISAILDDLDNSFEARDRKIGALNGFILDGDSGIGKTTLIDTWAKETHRKLIAANPERVDVEFTGYAPVISFNLPEKPSPATILRRISDFIGIPRTKAGGLDWLRANTINHLKHLGTEVLIIDEIQHIEFSGRKTTPAGIACLKDIGNALDIYMVFVGSNLKNTQLLSAETQEGASPFAARFQTTELLPVVSPQIDTTWAAVIKAVEKNLRLIDHDNQLHIDAADLLWESSNGRIRTLTDLIRRANHKAIRTGDEELTAEALDSTTVDRLAHLAA